MPVLEPRRTVRSSEPTLLVENAFAPGSYLFQLVCMDDAGNLSDPTELTVTVRPRVIREPRDPRPRQPFDPRDIVREPDRPIDRFERVTPGRIRRPPGG